jgi:hypothetical protein
MFTEPGSARQEAERLVAAVLAAAAMAANANPQLSTGSAECCVCPLCRVIKAVRDPDPEMVERLASGAGDLAAGVASFLRHVAAPSTGDNAWRRATEADAQAQPERPKKTVVKKTVAKKAAPKKAAPKKAG